MEVEEIYVLSREALSIVHSQDEASAYRYLLKAKTKEGERFFISKALVLAVGAFTPEENAAVSVLIEEEKKTGSPPTFSDRTKSCPLPKHCRSSAIRWGCG